jgi:hypothetical protein
MTAPAQALPRRRSQRRDACLDRPRLTWQTASWADTGRLVEWLEAKGMRERFLACGVADEVTRWRKGGTTSFWQVDRVFTKLGLHVGQLPDSVWAGHRCG